MEFRLSEEQYEFRESIQRFCKSRRLDRTQAEKRRATVEYDHAAWQLFAELGWLGLMLPEDVGGHAGTWVEAAILLQEFGRHLLTEPFIACAVLAASVVNRCGSTEQRRQLLGTLVRGERILALAHAEGSNWLSPGIINTRAAVRPGGQYVLTGFKPCVLGGAVADSLVVSARMIGGADSSHDIGLFIVDCDQPHVLRRSYRTLDGVPACDVQFLGVEIAAANALQGADGAWAGIEGAAFEAILAFCALGVGAMDGALDATVEHLRTRRAFGTTLSSFQALQHRLASMYSQVELGRSALHVALAGMSSGDDYDRCTAILGAKALVGSSSRSIGAEAVQLHGAVGMADDHAVGQYFKLLTFVSNVFGSSDSFYDLYARRSIR